MQKIINVFLASVITLGVLSVSGCGSTWDGVGKDIEQMGKDIQGPDETKKTSE